MILMQITLAVETDLPEIMELVKASIQKLNDDSIDQWDEVYPTKQLFEHDIKRNSLYKYLIGTNIAAIVTLSEDYPIEYNNIEWNDKSSKHLIIHRLVVAPRYQGQGISKSMLLFAEKTAIEKQYESIKLDSFIDNKISMALYISMGYRRVGSVNFRKGTFACFKKYLKDKNSGLTIVGADTAVIS